VNQPPSHSNQWFVCPRVNPNAETRLFLFPYAGGGPPAFSKWSAELPNTVEVWTAHYPGRGSRYNEPPIKEFAIMVDELYQAIQSLLDKPFAFFGHSMGGLIAFELARKLPQLHILFVSACGAPHMPDPHPPIHTLPKDGFVKSLQELNGIPAEILNNTELMELILPSLRADFEVVENYQYTSGNRLACPIIAFGGLEDPRVGRERLEGWALHTGNFKSQYFPGDHFFINTARKSVMDFIVAEMTLLYAKR
jgi:medium-chain acyl-[acyl-carrier-protein] hydrolase